MKATIMYTVLRSDDTEVLRSTAIMHEGRLGPELVYEEIKDLPAGEYLIVPGDIRLEVRDFA